MNWYLSTADRSESLVEFGTWNPRILVELESVIVYNNVWTDRGWVRRFRLFATPQEFIEEFVFQQRTAEPKLMKQSISRTSAYQCVFAYIWFIFYQYLFSAFVHSCWRKKKKVKS